MLEKIDACPAAIPFQSHSSITQSRKRDQHERGRHQSTAGGPHEWNLRWPVPRALLSPSRLNPFKNKSERLVTSIGR